MSVLESNVEMPQLSVVVPFVLPGLMPGPFGLKFLGAYGKGVMHTEPANSQPFVMDPSQFLVLAAQLAHAPAVQVCV